MKYIGIKYDVSLLQSYAIFEDEIGPHIIIIISNVAIKIMAVPTEVYD